MRNVSQPKIEFSPEERQMIVGRIQDYFESELDQSIGAIPAELLLQFFTDEMGGFYYNRGLADAHTVFNAKLDDINDEIYALEYREARVR